MKLDDEILDVAEEVLENSSKEEQMIKAQEECLELALAISHSQKKNKITEKEIITEIADVYIMCTQLISIFGKDKVQAEIDYKLKRIRKRLKNKTL